jgi:hypothetical protein
VRVPSLGSTGTPHWRLHAIDETDRIPLGATQPVSDERVVVNLIKAASNPFPERISVGRAPNCDVVIRDPSVSKLHGHFREVRSDSAVFTDAKSSNGTRVDGSLVEPGEPVEILRQGLVVLGRVRLVLMSAADVYDWLL